jgi:hypothetical protein
MKRKICEKCKADLILRCVVLLISKVLREAASPLMGGVAAFCALRQITAV